MCESRVYLATAEGEELILEDVTSIRPEGDGYRLVNLFGQQVHVRGRIVDIDLLKHRVTVEPVVDDSTDAS
jgi:predicted RNA-binding protein